MKNSMKLFTLIACVTLAGYQANAAEQNCSTVAGTMQAGTGQSKGKTYIYCQNASGGTIKSYLCSSPTAPANASGWDANVKKCASSTAANGFCAVTCK